VTAWPKYVLDVRCLGMKGPAGRGKEILPGYKSGQQRIEPEDTLATIPDLRDAESAMGKGLFTPSHVLKAGLSHIRAPRE
jgi:hypothetical protein